MTSIRNFMKKRTDPSLERRATTSSRFDSLRMIQRVPITGHDGSGGILPSLEVSWY